MYCFTRGYHWDVNRFIHDLSAQPWPFPNFKKANIIQTGVRPIQFWEFVFPKDCLPQFYSTVNMSGVPLSTKQEYAMKLMRTMLQAKKIPDDIAEVPPRAVWKQNIECRPIGIREDVNHKEGHEML